MVPLYIRKSEISSDESKSKLVESELSHFVYRQQELYGPKVGNQHQEILQDLLDQKEQIREKEARINEKIESHVEKWDNFNTGDYTVPTSENEEDEAELRSLLKEIESLLVDQEGGIRVQYR